MHVELIKYLPVVLEGDRIGWRRAKSISKDLSKPPDKGLVINDEGRSWYVVQVEEDINSESFIAHMKLIHKDEIHRSVMEYKITH